MLNETKWLDEGTKTKALKHLHDRIGLIGFPDFYLDDKKLDGHYAEVWPVPKILGQRASTLSGSVGGRKG